MKAAREQVLLTHALPQWIGPEIESSYDLLPLELAGDAGSRARVLITPGPAPVGGELLDRLPALEYIAAIGSGIEGIDTGYTSRRGIVVSNSAAATAEDVADHALALALAVYSRVPWFDQTVRTGQWPVKTMRRSLGELRAGIVGLGAIGLAVARRLEPLVAKVCWHGPRARESPYEYVNSLEAIARMSDLLVIAARADSSNVGLIGTSVLDALGPSGMIVNVSRGSIIDEDALIAALKAGRLGGAALDVFRTEPSPAGRWQDVPNTVLAPHVGGYATGVQRRIQQLLAANLSAFFAGRELSGVVDFVGPRKLRRLTFPGDRPSR